MYSPLIIDEEDVEDGITARQSNNFFNSPKCYKFFAMKTPIESFDRLQPGMVTVLGVPYDENSSFMKGPASAPPRIREVLNSGAMNLCSESGIDLGAEPRFHDLGDLNLSDGAATFEQIEKAITDLIERKVLVLSLGGDHAITYPISVSYTHLTLPTN